MASAVSSASQKPEYETQMPPPARTLCACNGARARGQSLCPSMFTAVLPWPGRLWYRFPSVHMAEEAAENWRCYFLIRCFLLIPQDVCGWSFHGIWVVLSSKTHVHYNLHKTVPFSLLGREYNLNNPKSKWSFLKFLRNYFKNCVSKKRHRRKDKLNAPLTEFFWCFLFVFHEVFTRVLCRTSYTIPAVVLDTRGCLDGSAGKGSFCWARWP